MLLTALLTCVYILTGTFRSLLTFIGITVTEYLIFLLTVLAIFRLRLYPPPSSSPAVKPAIATIYRTNVANPILFCVLSVLLVGTGMVT
jgi:hypothetical protein